MVENGLYYDLSAKRLPDRVSVERLPDLALSMSRRWQQIEEQSGPTVPIVDRWAALATLYPEYTNQTILAAAEMAKDNPLLAVIVHQQALRHALKVLPSAIEKTAGSRLPVDEFCVIDGVFWYVTKSLENGNSRWTKNFGATIAQQTRNEVVSCVRDTLQVHNDHVTIGFHLVVMDYIDKIPNLDAVSAKDRSTKVINELALKGVRLFDPDFETITAISEWYRIAA